MPPKNKYTRKGIIAAAFELARIQGIKGLTARKIAGVLKSSTAPVYSQFKNMPEVEKEIYKESKDLLLEYTKRTYTKYPFRNIGIGIVLFARDEKMLFRSLFMENHDFKDVINEFIDQAFDSMRTDSRFDGLNDDARRSILQKSWLFTHGLATMICAGVVKDDSIEYIGGVLTEMGMAVIDTEIKKYRNA